jgi:hypothetical protein
MYLPQSKGQGGKLSLRCLIIAGWLVAIVLQVAVGQTNEPGKEIGQVPTGTITGRVTLDGKPLPEVAVSLVPTKLGAPFSPNNPGNRTVTDSDGKFRMTTVPAGVFTLTVSPGPFVIPNDGYGPTGRVVAVRAGEEVKGIDLALKRGGIITGQVADADGLPIVGQRVTLEALVTGGTRRQIETGPPNDTDDQGIYRLYGLPAGRYLVTIRSTRDLGVTGYSTVYYPGVTQMSDAGIIEVGDGEEKRNVNIVLNRLGAGYLVAGRIVNSLTGSPVANIRYRLAENSKDTKSAATLVTGRTNEKGEFLSSRIPPGSYLIFALPDSQSEVYSDSVPLVISDSDVKDLEIKVHRGATLNGTLFIEGIDSASSPETFAGLWVSAGQYDETGRLNTVSTKVSKDGSFRISPLGPGKTYLLANGDPPTRISLLRIEKDGQEQRNGIEISGDAVVSGVRLFAAYANNTLRGEISLRNGTPSEATRFRVALMKPGIRDRIIATAEAGSDRRFVMTDVPTGDFDLMVLAIPTSSSTPPAQLPASVTKRLNITSGTNDVVIDLDPARP